MSKGAASTGIGPTVLVAIEQFFPKNRRGIEDGLSYRILPFGMKSFVGLMRFECMRNWIIRASEKDIPGIWGGMICRKRYIDEKLVNSITLMGTVVNLGAGFDTRTYRLSALSDKLTFEIDQPEIIIKKKRRLLKLFGLIPSHLKLVPVDFGREDLGCALKPHGYSAEIKTFYIMEAVTQYLTENAIKAIFNFLAKAGSGSQLVLTYIRKDFLDGRVMYGWEKAYRKYVLKDKIWLFGMDPEAWPDFLGQYGWESVEDADYEKLSGRYVKPTGRELASTPVERLVHARKL
jgi:methyltransferase (TIGR00027 family)